MSRFLAKRYEKLVAYVPGEQPRDKKYIKLNTNESPYPPSPLVIERVNAAEVSDLRLYSDPECTSLRQKLADFYDFLPSNIFVSNGSDEILSFAFMAFCDENKGIAFPDISYGFYPVYGDLYGIECDIIPLNSDYTVDCTKYYGIGKNIIIANPNAPTGISIELAEIEKMLVTNPQNIVIIDEAYVDFGGTSCVDLVKKYDNLLVVRTFSKSRSLAGARLGYAIACEEIIADLNKIKYSTNPYNINRLSLVAGEAAVLDEQYFSDCCKKIIETREYTAEKLRKIGFEVLPSDANFIFARHPSLSGESFYKKLKEAGILVRYFNKDRLYDFVRISIGTPEQMNALISEASRIIFGQK